MSERRSAGGESERQCPVSSQTAHDTGAGDSTPLARIYASQLRPANISNKFVSPAAVEAAIADTPVFAPTTLYLITGVDGSGRAQLCAWLRDRLRTGAAGEAGPNRVVCHITASNSSPSAVLTTLAEPFDVQLNITPLSGVGGANLAKTALWRLQNRDHVDGVSQLERTQLATRRSGIDLFGILTDHLNRAMAGDTQVGAIPDLLPRETYRQLLTSVLETAPTDRKRRQLVLAIRDGLRYALGIEDVHAILDTICAAAVDQGVRPVVVCDDFSAVSPLLRRAMLQYCTKATGHFEIILGGSARWFSDANRQLAADRDIYCYVASEATGHLSLSDADGVPYFLGTESATALARQSHWDVDRCNE